MSLRPPLLHLKPRSDHLPASTVTPASTMPAVRASTMRASTMHVSTMHVSTMHVSAGLVESDALLRGGREVLIRHGDEVYRLRHTRNDKLILTK